MTNVSPCTALVVEDDDASRKMVVSSLTRVGFLAWAAANGQEGLDILRTKPVDLIICDIMMPEMDGFEFRDKVMLDPATRNLPFVFLTEMASAEAQVRGLRKGVDEYIVKPVDPLVLVARVLAVLERRKAYAEMVRQDTLTQLLNRQTLENEIAKEIERLKRHKGVGSLLFMDLDRFKRVNDDYGHAMGDLVLVKFAELLRSLPRKIDVAGRYGGEEFVVYLPSTSAPEGAQAAERLLRELQEMTLPPPGLRMTFSAGVAEALAHGEDFSTLCSRADQAMYEAKRQGRARVVVWSPAILP